MALNNVINPARIDYAANLSARFLECITPRGHIGFQAVYQGWIAQSNLRAADFWKGHEANHRLAFPSVVPPRPRTANHLRMNSSIARAAGSSGRMAENISEL